MSSSCQKPRISPADAIPRWHARWNCWEANLTPKMLASCSLIAGPNFSKVVAEAKTGKNRKTEEKPGTGSWKPGTDGTFFISSYVLSPWGGVPIKRGSIKGSVKRMFFLETEGSKDARHSAPFAGMVFCMLASSIQLKMCWFPASRLASNCLAVSEAPTSRVCGRCANHGSI